MNAVCDPAGGANGWKRSSYDSASGVALTLMLAAPYASDACSPMTDAVIRLNALASIVIWGCEQATPSLGYQIVQTYDHDPEAYTQGLLFHDGHLFESTGRYGASTLRKVDVETGRVVASVAVDSAYFAEGLALVGSELIQLTWKAGIAFVYDLETLELKTQHHYAGDGWGLCFDGASLFMSDGTSKVLERDPKTFEVLSEITVLQEGFTRRR